MSKPSRRCPLNRASEVVDAHLRHRRNRLRRVSHGRRARTERSRGPPARAEPERIAAALAPLGLGEQDYAIGDVTDAASVERDMDRLRRRCRMPPRCTPSTRAAKQLHIVSTVGGTETVFGAAEAELDPIVVSVEPRGSFSAGGARYSTSSRRSRNRPAPTTGPRPIAEQVARTYRERGVPVVSSYPGGAFGPA